MHDAMDEAILLLAGGEATRFPGKLECKIEGKPMIERVLERLSGSRPVYLAVKAGFACKVDAPLLIDRWPGGGPLLALLGAATQIDAERIFAVAADQPMLEHAVLERLSAAWEPGDEAVVPQHEGGMEPLAALYDRRALLREGERLRRVGRRAMHDLIASLATRFVTLDRSYFHNVNEASDLFAVTRTS
jgi:molybdopterin-guanine dinucleotide biosynthesis protein A